MELRLLAMALAGVARGVACAGTALESTTYTIRGKAFLFVSAKEARLKLEASAAEAKRLGFAVGKNGWVKLPLDALPLANVAKRWIGESYATIGGSGATRTAAKPRGKRRA